MEAAAKCAEEAVTKRAEEAEYRAEMLRQQVREVIQRAEAAEKQKEDMKLAAEEINRNADKAYEELSVLKEQFAQELEIQVAEARDEAEEKTGLNFLYTL
mgnify:CR=1 FL=1